MTEGIDRRSPFYESRRKTDCFPDGGAVVIGMGIVSIFAFAFGFVLGRWVF